MAMAMPVSTAAERRANFLRVAALVIDGGALALKNKFDAIFPPQRLTQDLQANQPILKHLGKNRVLTRVQLDLLLPAPPVNADSSTFDVCLFACLIQNLPAFGQQNSPVWTQKGLPPPGDKSLAADVQRLRFMRNKLCHATVASITDQEYIDISQEVLGAIGRQGQNSDVQALLFDFHNKTIDPAMENEYAEKLKEWERFDRQLHEALEKLKENIDAIKGEVAECKEGMQEMEKTTIRADETAQENKGSIKSLRIQFEDSKTTIEKNKTAIELIGKEKDISSQYKALFGNSKLFFQSQEKIDFIETNIFKDAHKRLGEKKIIILTGHPGEGKSSMAKQLLTRFAADKCLYITHTTDWDHVDLSVKQPDAIIIDDIFGVSVFDKGLFDYWTKKLDNLLLAATKYNIFVILTSRHYILEESKVFVKTLPPFNQIGHEILLSSTKLTDDEKVQILESHLKAEKRSINRDSVNKCIFNYTDVQKTLLGEYRFTFGFPQCAALYSRRNDLFNDRRERFFKNPDVFFKQCIEQLSGHEMNFLALILLWVNPKQRLHRSNINDYFMSEEIKSISKELHFEMNEDLVRSLEKTLESHIGGLLHFSNETGIFTFSHSVIGDMIGLVTAQQQQKTEFVVAHGSDQFLIFFVNFEEEDHEFKFRVPAYLMNERLQGIKEWCQMMQKLRQEQQKLSQKAQELVQKKQKLSQVLQMLSQTIGNSTGGVESENAEVDSEDAKVETGESGVQSEDAGVESGDTGMLQILKELYQEKQESGDAEVESEGAGVELGDADVESEGTGVESGDAGVESEDGGAALELIQKMQELRQVTLELRQKTKKLNPLVPEVSVGAGVASEDTRGESGDAGVESEDAGVESGDAEVESEGAGVESVEAGVESDGGAALELSQKTQKLSQKTQELSQTTMQMSDSMKHETN